MKHAVQHIHFVGIGGVGMSGIAEVLLGLGYRVSGSDATDSATLRRLASLGITTYVGHSASQVQGAQVLVTSSAVGSDNAEVRAALERRIPVLPRAVMLAELMRLQQGIAIAGTHGKTTTTSLVVSVMTEAGLDPTFVIGGHLNSAGAHARLGSGAYVVVEADESDASFLQLLPVLAVVTNIDADHMETYGHDLGRLKQAFVDFLHRMPFYGRAVVCTDDATVREIVPQLHCPLLTYGMHEGAQIRAVDVRALGTQMHFTVQRQCLTADGQPLADLPVVLNLAGRHNVLNALAVIGVAQTLGVPDAPVLAGLANFKGVGRRFQGHGDVPCAGGGTMTVIEDYGHHPVEVAATLAAARGAYPGRRLVLAFQPHRYTRTRDCFADFVQVLAQADALFLSEVYAAGEPPIAGADGRSLAAAVGLTHGSAPVFVPRIEDMADAIARGARAGDVLLCMGAGSIGHVAAQVVTLAQTKTEGSLA